MIEIYSTFTDSCNDRLKKVLSRHIAAPFEILCTKNGKPYISGNPVYFSLSHSGQKAVFAVCDKPVGIDIEIYKARDRKSVISRFTEREQTEITNERDFLKHWTAREAYIKLYGLTLAETLKRIEFFGGILHVDGQPQSVKIRHYDFGYGIAAICTEK